MRSISCSGEGFAPMSVEKLAKSFDRGSIVMARPPQLAKSLNLGLPQRWRIRHHDVYSGDSFPSTVCPWVVLRSTVLSILRQPQLAVLPLTTFPLLASISFLQSHRNRHFWRPPITVVIWTAVSRPNRIPVMSTDRDIISCYCNCA